MIFYESSRLIDLDANPEDEIAEQRQTRVVNGKYVKGLRQLFVGQCTVRLDILWARMLNSSFVVNGTIDS